jgi:hypothetical protein
MVVTKLTSPKWKSFETNVWSISIKLAVKRFIKEIKII